jgi:hypothetical protein
LACLSSRGTRDMTGIAARSHDHELLPVRFYVALSRSL